MGAVLGCFLGGTWEDCAFGIVLSVISAIVLIPGPAKGILKAILGRIFSFVQKIFAAGTAGDKGLSIATLGEDLYGTVRDVVPDIERFFKEFAIKIRR
jgi:hypothetical protein